MTQTKLLPDILDLHPTYGRGRYTLRGIYEKHDRGREVARAWQQKGFDVYEFIERAPDGQDLLFVATRHARDARPRAGIPHTADTKWAATRLFIATFRYVMRRAKAKGHGTRWYKDLEEGKIHRLVGSLRLGGSVREAAAAVLSSTIVAHPFPNGNHRTSVQLALLFLRAQGLNWPRYSLRGRGDKRLFSDCQPFFKQSKTLLLLIRRPGLVEVAKKHGYQWIQLTPLLVVDCRALDPNRPKRELQEQHRTAALKLVDALADPNDSAALDAPNKMKLREWVAKNAK